MTRSFLLRFQEPCQESALPVAAHGTVTKTAVAQEGPDADPWNNSVRIVPNSEHSHGTMSGTRIRTEQSDADYGSALRTLPVQMTAGTMTATAVKMETDDRDKRQQEVLVLPRCS